ncbi:Copper binding protein, plastocyanin/azurin family [hydrothermal vent metagenome]|uniref:Copper binding protein, plastocyanin/azurin family n=2 Tax=hydrothermal vent metagenome TaxID=652676 RepID=A0A3B0UV96_9ZZZZ
MNTMTRYGRYPALLILSLILIITVTNLQAAVIRNSDGSVAALNAVTDGLWSDPLSWGGAVPSDGEVVEIPAGITIMLDTDTANLAGLTIVGTLQFAEQDVSLTSDWILVQGTLQVGTEATPFTNQAVITLTGDPATQNIMGMGTRGIMVMGGVLELHGVSPATIWSKIDGHIAAGANQLTVLDATGWQAGDQIVIAPTDYYGVAESEDFVLTAVAGNQLTVNTPINAARWGVLQYVTDTGMSLTPDPDFVPPAAPFDDEGNPTPTPTILDERAEVGNLTRNIVIQAPEDDLWNNDGFGAQVVVGKTEAGVKGFARVEGVELRRVGQAGILARYPFHWHRMSYDEATGAETGGVEGQYLRNSVIRQSANRCVTIHATNGATIQNNICYDILGHALFFEDGTEQNNVVDGNLVLKVRNPAVQNALKFHDVGPHPGGSSCIWVSNPTNTVINNTLADCEKFGMWMAFPDQPTGPSSNVAMRPSRELFGNFDSNTMHSNGNRGVMFDFAENAVSDDFVALQYFSTNDGGATTQAPFTNLQRFYITGWQLWKNGGDGNFWNRVYQPTYSEFVSADAQGKFFAGSGSLGIIERALMVGTSLNNTEATDPRIYSSTAFASYHSAFGFQDNIVVNFPEVAGITSGAFASDDYYIRPVDKGRARSSGNMLINSFTGFRSDAAINENLSNNFAQGFTSYVFSGALWDPENLYGFAGEWNVYNREFLTHGANCNIVQQPSANPFPPPDGRGKLVHPGAAICDGTYFGVDSFILDKGAFEPEDTMPIRVTRFDDNNPNLPLADIWEVMSFPGQALPVMRHFAARNDGIYLLEFPESAIPADVSMNIENMHEADDMFVLGVSYSGAEDAWVFSTTYNDSASIYNSDAHGAAGSWSYKHDYAEMNSRQELFDSQGEAFWQDNANNIVWIKVGINHPSLGLLAQYVTNPTRTDGSPAQPDDDFYLYNPFRLRIMPNPHTILPFATVGVAYSNQLPLAVGDESPQVRSTTSLLGGMGLNSVDGFIEGVDIEYSGNGYGPYLAMPPVLSGIATEPGRNYIRLSMPDGSTRTFVMDVIADPYEIYLPMIRQ